MISSQSIAVACAAVGLAAKRKKAPTNQVGAMLLLYGLLLVLIFGSSRKPSGQHRT
jgi:L-lactate permease